MESEFSEPKVDSQEGIQNMHVKQIVLLKQSQKVACVLLLLLYNSHSDVFEDA